LEESSSHILKNEKELLDESDKYSLSHQRVFHEMK